MKWTLTMTSSSTIKWTSTMASTMTSSSTLKWTSTMTSSTTVKWTSTIILISSEIYNVYVDIKAQEQGTVVDTLVLHWGQIKTRKSSIYLSSLPPKSLQNKDDQLWRITSAVLGDVVSCSVADPDPVGSSHFGSPRSESGSFIYSKTLVILIFSLYKTV